MSHFLIHAARLQDAGVSILTVTLHVRQDDTRMMTVTPSGSYSAEVQRKFPARDFELCGTDRLLEQLEDDMAYAEGGPTPQMLLAAIEKHPLAADDLRAWYADYLRCPPLTDAELAELPEVDDASVQRSVERLKGIMKGLDIARTREVMKAPDGGITTLGGGPPGDHNGTKAEAVRGLRSLKALLGTDAPEVRGWAPAVQQSAQRVVNAAIVALSTPGVQGERE